MQAGRALNETRERRLLAPEAVFGGHCRHLCYADCGNPMTVPNPNAPGPDKLEDGQIWQCNRCGALHEYYMAFAAGSRWAVIRLLRGPHVREAGEPRIDEFMEDGNG